MPFQAEAYTPLCTFVHWGDQARDPPICSCCVGENWAHRLDIFSQHLESGSELVLLSCAGGWGRTVLTPLYDSEGPRHNLAL